MAVLKIINQRKVLRLKKAEKKSAGINKRKFCKNRRKITEEIYGCVIYEELGWLRGSYGKRVWKKPHFPLKKLKFIQKAISTQFGKHLLYIQEVQENKVKGSTYFIREVASQDSIAKSLREAETMKKKLDKKVTFETLKNINKNLLFTRYVHGCR